MSGCESDSSEMEKFLLNTDNESVSDYGMHDLYKSDSDEGRTDIIIGKPKQANNNETSNCSNSIQNSGGTDSNIGKPALNSGTQMEVKSLSKRAKQRLKQKQKNSQIFLSDIVEETDISQPGTSGAPKRNRSFEQESSDAKRKCFSPRKLPPENDIYKMVIIDESVVSGLTEEMSEKLKNFLLTEIDSAIDAGLQLQFRGIRFIEGTLRITCANDVALEWLKQKADDVSKISSNIRLAHMNEIRLTKVSIYLPGGRENIDTIFKRFQTQNVGIKTDKWKSHKSEEKENGCRYVLGIDKDSVEVLRKSEGHRLFYRAGQIGFRFFETDSGVESTTRKE